MKRGHIMILAAGLMASGCSSQLALHPAVKTSATADADRALTVAISDVDRAMAQMQGDPSSPTQLSSYVPAELQRPFNVNLTNVPIDQAASMLAQAAGYRVVGVDASRPQGPSVTLKAVSTPLIDLFRSLGSQGGTLVNVSVNADTKVIQIIHNGGVRA